MANKGMLNVTDLVDEALNDEEIVESESESANAAILEKLESLTAEVKKSKQMTKKLCEKVFEVR